MGVGNWIPNKGSHNGEFFYVDIPCFEERQGQCDYDSLSDFWSEDLINDVCMSMPDCYEEMASITLSEKHWGEDFLIMGESNWYFVGLKWWQGCVVVFVALKELSDDYWHEQQSMENLGNHALGHCEEIYKKLYSMGYEISFRAGAWCSTRYRGEQNNEGE